MIPLIGITGGSGVGKTTLAVKLIEELSKRGYKVAAIKHTAHQVDVDKEGKDSDLMHKAGAAAVALASSSRIAMYMDTEDTWVLDKIVSKLFPSVDMVIVEGYGDAPIPRIGLVRKGAVEELKVRKGLIAVVSDMEVDTPKPVFSFEQVPEIADLMQEYIGRMGPKRDVKLFVNGESVQIKPFIKDFFLKTISAMVDSLKGTGSAERIRIVIDKPGGDSGD